VALALAEGGSVDRVQIDFFGRLAERDTRLLTLEVLLGALRGDSEDEPNAVNAPALAEERGIRIVEAKHSSARDYTDLIRVEVTAGENTVRVAGTLIGRQNRPHLLEAWGQRFDVQLEEHVTLFRYRDLPGMLGRAGTAFGAAGVNIISAAVGRQPEGEPGSGEGLAAMAITTSEPVPQSVVDELAGSDGFVLGQTVAL
jgi:D-3-phosphoglycerate dehydrogenase